MWNLVIRHKLIAVFLGILMLVGLSMAWDASAATRGRMLARFDLSQGRYQLLAYGSTPPEREEYARLLKQRYGIEVEKVADCLVSQPLVDYVDAYNSITVPAAQAKFGPHIFDQTWEDAQRSWVHGVFRQNGRNPVDWLFQIEKPKTSDAACFHEFTAGASMQKIVEKCGRPDAETGTDRYVFVYNLEAGAKVTISGPYLSHVEKISYQSATAR
ncbi:MAG TPA: hypothetical protein VJW20_03485 [Candidatus Angelobacter sp.]|nr:hypothetical protein [Candidatus Angelobacter sp.]